MRKIIILALALVLSFAALPMAASASEMVELVSTNIILDETEFEYTGKPIFPNVTVRVDGKLLTLDKEYRLSFDNNVEVGTAKVIVTGVATKGYTGTVEHPFFIREKKPEFQLIPIKGTDVTIDGTQFPYTGEEVKPGITVTVEGEQLVENRDYAVEYINNLLPGKATVIVRGIVTASETKGYEGEVRIDYTILPAEEKPTDPTEKPTQPAEPSQPTEPTEKPTEPTTPSQPEEETYSYKITKGNNAAWFQGSSTALSFTVDGPYAEFQGVEVDGKAISKDHFSVKDGTVVLLKNSYLKTLKTGSHKVDFLFEEGKAQGTFRISAADENPKTGDAIGVWLITMALTGTALIILGRKKLTK